METRHYKWILKEAKRRGLVVRKAPSRYKHPGKRIGGALKYDRWMNAANNKLWEYQVSPAR